MVEKQKDGEVTDGLGRLVYVYPKIIDVHVIPQIQSKTYGG